MHSLHKRSKLICTVAEKDGVPEFVVTVEEPGQQNLVFRDTTTKGALIPVLNAIGKNKWLKVTMDASYAYGKCYGVEGVAIARGSNS